MKTKAFFIETFGWCFEDYGPEYIAFSVAGLAGGFFQSDLVSTAATGGTLAVLNSEKLEMTQLKVESAGGIVVQTISSFPGGRRFHFTEPSGNELAVWSDRV